MKLMLRDNGFCLKHTLVSGWGNWGSNPPLPAFITLPGKCHPREENKEQPLLTEPYMYLNKEVVIYVFFLFFFLGPRMRCMEVPRLGVELELQEPAYITATVTPDPRLQLTAKPDP